ncbi:uncharacterized protein BKA78DRAFT_356896 [Phyllosticta capitalensis]|uniref:uncharacterized protein n=1 Tax=Phyllosticta capitalensis TaxID=121624 RepID=UPI00312FB798
MATSNASVCSASSSPTLTLAEMVELQAKAARADQLEAKKLSLEREVSRLKRKQQVQSCKATIAQLRKERDSLRLGIEKSTHRVAIEDLEKARSSSLEHEKLKVAHASLQVDHEELKKTHGALKESYDTLQHKSVETISQLEAVISKQYNLLDGYRARLGESGQVIEVAHTVAIDEREKAKSSTETISQLEAIISRQYSLLDGYRARLNESGQVVSSLRHVNSEDPAA